MAQTGFLMIDAESGCSCRMSISSMRTYIHRMYDVQMHKCVDIATTALRAIRRSKLSERRANLAISEAHDASLTAQYPCAARFSRTSVRASDDLHSLGSFLASASRREMTSVEDAIGQRGS
jgi:hypothetical protein